MSNRDILKLINSTWNYSDPEKSRNNFFDLLKLATLESKVDLALQLETQIARTYSLVAEFDKASDILEQLEPRVSDEYAEAKARYHLEKGRIHNSNLNKSKAVVEFKLALEASKLADSDFLTVDTLHMLALASESFEEKINWNKHAVKIAINTSCEDTHNWLGSLSYNMGWDFFFNNDYLMALEHFERAQTFCEKKNRKDFLNVVKWGLAKTLRYLGKAEEALKIQNELLNAYIESGTPSGHVFEELGELHIDKNKKVAKEYFKKAYELLSKDLWIPKHEPERLERLKSLSN